MESARVSGPAELASLLRSRRERLQPADVGLPAGVRRRTRGLRREEVAQLASVSTTYYTFLEQGRNIRPSRQILDALAAARHPDDPGFAELIERLHAGSPEVRAWWPRHDVAPLSSGTKRIRHPVLGDLTFQHVVLQLADDPEQKVVTFAATAADQARIARLLG
jgi:hypothetical protein